MQLSHVVLIVIVGVAGAARMAEGDEGMSASSDNPSGAAQETATPTHTNRLAGESSPYLLQHAHNPVDWYPWGEEALTLARKEAKPIFLSIGYSACHWCHVMEHESFEDPEIAKVLNAYFVSIKVDREERPDIDQIYMHAVQMMTGSGGWPLSVFLTPDLEPFFGGTYFPPTDRYGRPGFKSLLGRIVEVWREDPEEVKRSAARLTQALRDVAESGKPATQPVDASILTLAATELAQTFDPKWGGFGVAPKFPPSAAIAVLLRQHRVTGDAKLLTMAKITLDRMAYGGMYDQLGGGFHRYSTDERWLVPHFEKMLYDNALLAEVYVEAWQATHEPLYRRVATEILDYVRRDMTDSRGGFHSSEDADSEGEEGKFYVWSPEEIKEVFGDGDGTLFCDYYNVTTRGNFEGRSILNVPIEPAEFAREKGVAEKELEQRLALSRAKLLEVRDRRVGPGKDEKVLAAWNGMMISALARGYQVLGEERFREAAERAAEFVLSEMDRDGVLLRSYRGAGDSKDAGVSKLPGYLDDYAEMANGLVDLYEATFSLRWLEAADELSRRMIESFWDEQDGGFFYTSDDHKNLLVRMKPYYDGSVPSGNSTGTYVLLRLARLLGTRSYQEKAERVLTSAREAMSRNPSACLNLLVAADFYVQPTREIAVVGGRTDVATRRLLEIVHARFIPNKVLALVEPGTTDAMLAERRIPLLKGKTRIDGKPAVYLCENYVCEQPVTDGAALGRLLDNGR